MLKVHFCLMTFKLAAEAILDMCNI